MKAPARRANTPSISLREKLRDARATLKRELAVYKLLLKHERTPRGAKILLSLAIGYVLLPFDIIPDFIPVIGHLDDAVIVPGLVLLALKRIPPDLVRECREQVRESEVSAQ